jgi:hypothetical protein
MALLNQKEASMVAPFLFQECVVAFARWFLPEALAWGPPVRMHTVPRLLVRLRQFQARLSSAAPDNERRASTMPYSTIGDCILLILLKNFVLFCQMQRREGIPPRMGGAAGKSN